MTASMTCPDVGVWRAWLDNAAGDQTDALAAHQQACASCRETVAGLRADADFASRVLDSLAPFPYPTPAELSTAHLRAAAARRASKGAPTASAPAGAPTISPVQEHSSMWKTRFSRWRAAIAGAAALVAVGVAGATPQGQALAAQFLAQFHSERLQPVPVTSTQLRDIGQSLQALGNLGTVQNGDTLTSAAAGRRPAALQTTTVSTVAQADQKLPFTVKVPDASALPAGATTPTKIEVSAPSQVRFTFNAAKARAYFQTTGHPNVSIPQKFDGASLVISVPPAVLMEYGSYGKGSTQSGSALIVSEAGEVSVGTEGGVSLSEMRDFLLSLPELPPQTAQELRSITDWTQTLPIPVVVDRYQWQQTTVGGSSGGSGLLLDDRSGMGSALVWHTGSTGKGQIFAVAGTLPTASLQSVAASLH